MLRRAAEVRLAVNREPTDRHALQYARADRVPGNRTALGPIAQMARDVMEHADDFEIADASR